MVAALRSLVSVPHAERRGPLRHPVKVGGVLDSAGGEQHQVVLIDIAEQGCQIVRPAGLTGGTSIRLGFGGFAPFDATVVWTSADSAGLRFDYPAHPALIAEVVAAARGRKRPQRLLASSLIQREERERRWHLSLPVSFSVEPIGEDSAPLDAQLTELWTDGCRVTSAVTLLPGTTLSLSLGDRSALTGQVRWTREETVEIVFAEPLSTEAVTAIAQA